MWVAPPVPLSSGLGWLPISRLGFAHPGLISVCGLLSGGSFFGRPSLFLPRLSGLNPVGGFPLFFLSRLIAFFLFESWRNGLLGALWG